MKKCFLSFIIIFWATMAYAQPEILETKVEDDITWKKHKK
jgi:hypothetical protein